MDVGMFIALAMLAVWAAGTFFAEAPGWLHLFLSAGVFLLIWRIVVRRDASQKRRSATKNGHSRSDA